MQTPLRKERIHENWAFFFPPDKLSGLLFVSSPRDVLTRLASRCQKLIFEEKQHTLFITQRWAGEAEGEMIPVRLFSCHQTGPCFCSGQNQASALRTAAALGSLVLLSVRLQISGLSGETVRWSFNKLKRYFKLILLYNSQRLVLQEDIKSCRVIESHYL